jgi:hypothetical protein
MGGEEEGGVEDIRQEERFSRANEFAGYGCQIPFSVMMYFRFRLRGLSGIDIRYKRFQVFLEIIEVILQANRIEDFFSCSSLKSVLQNSDLLIINLVVNLVADLVAGASTRGLTRAKVNALLVGFMT